MEQNKQSWFSFSVLGEDVDVTVPISTVGSHGGLPEEVFALPSAEGSGGPHVHAAHAAGKSSPTHIEDGGSGGHSAHAHVERGGHATRGHGPHGHAGIGGAACSSLAAGTDVPHVHAGGPGDKLAGSDSSCLGGPDDMQLA